MRTENRERPIDALRGLGIILVVLGHVLQGFNRMESNSVARESEYLIYSFHMPLFFIISGYVEGIKNRYVGLTYDFPNKYFTYIKKCVISLYIPCLFFSALYFVLKFHVLAKGSNIGNFKLISWMDFYKIPYLGFEEYWFLCTLFFVKVVHGFFEHGILNNCFKTAFWCLLLLLSSKCVWVQNIPALWKLCYYGFFFHVGYLLKTQIYKTLLNKHALLTIALSSLLSIICTSLNFQGLDLALIRLGAALGTSLTLFMTFFTLKIDNAFLVLCGQESMVIYCLHNYIVGGGRLFYGVFGSPLSVTCLICFSLALLLPLMLVKSYKSIRIINWIEYIFYPGKLFW